MSIDQTIQRYKAKLLHYEQQAEQAIRSAHSRMLSVVMHHIHDLLKQVNEKKLQDAFLMHWLYGRLHSIKRIVESQVNLFGDSVKSQILTSQCDGIKIGEKSAIDQLASHDIVLVSHMAFNKLIGHTQQGKPIADLMGGWGTDASDRVARAIIISASIGFPLAPNVTRVITDVLDINLNRALVIARTSLMEAYRSSYQLTLQENNIQQWEWVAQSGCCKYCASMDGTVHDMSEEMKSHPNCRCVQKVVT